MMQRLAFRKDVLFTFPVQFLCLAFLFLVIFAPTAWTGNEENYFQLAYRTVSPEKFGDLHAVFDNSHARIVPFYLLGYLVEWVGYDAAHTIARVGMALLYACTLALFFRSMGLSVIESMLVIAIFRFLGEQIVGGEWLFEGVEGKTFAYAFVFLSFYYADRSKWYQAILCVVAASYLHFLVGIFWASAIIFLIWLENKKLGTVFKFGIFFSALITPLLAIIIRDQFGASSGPTTFDGMTADYIYSLIRCPHHVAPFKGLSSVWGWSPGILLIVGLLALLLRLWRGAGLLKPGFAAIWGLGFLLFALVLSFFDRHAYHFGKFYLFRPSSLTLFLAVSSVVQVFSAQISEQARTTWWSIVSLPVVIFLWASIKQQVDTLRREPAIPLVKISSAIHHLTAPQDVILIEPYQEMDDDFVQLHRLADRQTVVQWKFVPTNPVEIIRWYSLMQKRNELFKNGCEPKPEILPDYLIVFNSDVAANVSNCGTVIWSDGGTQILQVKK